MLQRVDFKSHAFQVAQYPGIGCDDARCMDTGNCARINQCGMPALNVRMRNDLGYMAVAATDKIVISGARHAVAVMRIVGNEYPPPGKFQRGIHSMVNKIAAGFRHQILYGHHVAKIVAVYDMHGKAKLERGTQGIGTDQITAMYNCFCPRSMSCGHCSGERFGTVMAVGDDADFQFSLPYFEVESSAQLAAQLSIY